MTINPKIGFIAALVHAVLLALTGLGWATVFDAKTAAIVVFVLAALDSVTQAVINGFSAPKAGPLV
jgi:hypothetical protein